MGLFHDILFEANTAQFEKDLKDAYGIGFRDGRLCPADLRPCTVDGELALFHRFVDQDRGVLHIKSFIRPSHLENVLKNFNENSFIGPECELEKFRQTSALIEWPDGRLCTVALERVQFTDREGSRNG